MLSRKITYDISDLNNVKKTEEIVDDQSELARLVQEEALKHPPGTIVFGVQKDDEKPLVGPLEGF